MTIFYSRELAIGQLDLFDLLPIFFLFRNQHDTTDYIAYTATRLNSHINFQDVVDGLYYPFYMEWTRHAFMKEALGVDMEDAFKQGAVLYAA